MATARAQGKQSHPQIRRAQYGQRDGMNNVMIIGRLVADPEFRRTSTGVLMTRFRVATTVGGNTEFHSVVAWARLGQLVARQFTKGQLIRVDGSLQRRSWQAKTGEPGRAVEIKADWCYSLPRDYAG